MAVRYFENIIIRDVPIQSIYNRLGFSKQKTTLDFDKRREIDKFIEEAITVIELKGALLRIGLNCSAAEPNQVLLSNNIFFTSKALVDFIDEAQEIVVMAATAGKKVMDCIKELSAKELLTKAVIFDAVASEMVDSSLSWLMDFINRELIRESKLLGKRRFSAGYADFSLENQKIIFELLGLEKYGISLSKEYIFNPEKTVTAIAGIYSK